jgi:hypothetical protein
MSSRKADLWNRLVDEASEDEIDRAASVSVEQAERELAAAGFDVAAERAKASAFLDALERGELGAATPDASATRRKAQRPVVLWLVAAATAVAAAGVTYAALQPTPTPTSPAPDAADLRRRATAACDAQRWSECLADLDQARDADPAGDDTPAVKSLRAKAAAQK